MIFIFIYNVFDNPPSFSQIIFGLFKLIAIIVFSAVRLRAVNLFLYLQ